MPLVTGGPDVKLFHSNSNLRLAYLPSFGRYFSSNLSCRTMVPAVTVLVVVSCVPIPIVTTVCARAASGEPYMAAASARAASVRPKLLLIMTPLRSDSGPLVSASDVRGAQEPGQFSFERARRLVALKVLLPSFCAALSTGAAFVGRPDIAAAHLLQDVGPPHDDFRFADDKNVLVVEALEADGHPLPGRADHVREVRVGEGGTDQDAVGGLHPIKLDQMQQQISEPFGDRSRTEHLRQRGIALAFEGQAFDQPDGQVRHFRHELAQLLARQMQHAAVAGGDARPLVDAFPEHFRTADEVARMPIGQRDLALGGRGVINADAAGLDQEYAVVPGALPKQRLAAVEHAAPSAANQALPFGGRQGIEQRRGAPDGADIFGQQQRAAAAVAYARHVEPFRNLQRLGEDLHGAFRA